MKRKVVLFSEVSYILGIVFLGLGTALMEKADFGLSMVVAPAYLIHLKMSQYFPGFTFGMAEYSLQALLLVLLFVAIRKFKPIYMFSFVTAVLYGLALDGAIMLVHSISAVGMLMRIIVYGIGVICCTLGVSMMFHTYISTEVYELIVKEASVRFRKDIGVVKTVYDCTSCVVAIILSFAFFGFGTFKGIKAGSIICALFNGTLIGIWGKIMDGVFEFKDALKFRKVFEGV